MEKWALNQREWQLIKLVKENNDKEALKQLVDLYKDIILGVIDRSKLNTVYRDDVAYDAAVDTFESIVKNTDDIYLVEPYAVSGPATYLSSNLYLMLRKMYYSAKGKETGMSMEKLRELDQINTMARRTDKVHENMNKIYEQFSNPYYKRDIAVTLVKMDAMLTELAKYTSELLNSITTYNEMMEIKKERELDIMMDLGAEMEKHRKIAEGEDVEDEE
jgi:hypothetical protein